MSPSGLCIILSIPLGPKEERMSRATDLAATMLALCASNPLSRPFFSCSCYIFLQSPIFLHLEVSVFGHCSIMHTVYTGKGLKVKQHLFRSAHVLLRAYPNDDERPAILVESQRHGFLTIFLYFLRSRGLFTRGGKYSANRQSICRAKTAPQASLYEFKSV
jgi:hypothetical protein